MYMKEETWKSDAIKHVLAKIGYGINYENAKELIRFILQSK